MERRAVFGDEGNVLRDKLPPRIKKPRPTEARVARNLILGAMPVAERRYMNERPTENFWRMADDYPTLAWGIFVNRPKSVHVGKLNMARLVDEFPGDMAYYRDPGVRERLAFNNWIVGRHMRILRVWLPE